MRKYLLIIFASVLVLTACSSSDGTTETNNKVDTNDENTEQSDGEAVEDVVNTEEEINEEPIELTAQEEMLFEIFNLIDEGLAFDTGSYIKGDIPTGEYAYITFEGSGEYYSEEDASGSIIDNENFSSFGYVQVHEAGNLETRGILINTEALEELEVSGAKEVYEILNNTEDYHDSGWYKVGADIDPGEYVIESYGSGYVAVMSGPVGNSEIVKNDNFDGRYSINVQDGQYLNISRAKIAE